MELTVLSYGGGQDSKAILALLVNDKKMRAKYAPDKLVVVMSDTGDEHDYTYEDLKQVREICKEANIEFRLLLGSEGFHAPSWQDLITPQLRLEGNEYKATLVQMGTKSCTDQLKLRPIYKWLDEYCNDLGGFGFPINKTRGCLKKALKKWRQDHGQINMIIGFASGEESRSNKALKLEIKQHESEKDIWEKVISRRFPLVDLGINRAQAQALIESYGYNCPPPSNCMRCPYMSPQELLWLYRNHKEKFNEWVTMEDNKLRRDQAQPKFKKDGSLAPNNGVFGSKKTISDKLADAVKKFGHMTNEELNTYKFSHGCTRNAM